eukprot:TRINITY_DN6861_c0_g1_i1.p1 TRINITY_DN6861_c0_g1~~TRINITY_DN6861_c0_g1_i1.p1  ORF type:complete len:538 (+),score=136.61 TRINITY_DN6861_c0_g1_i1:44-1657(+)
MEVLLGYVHDARSSVNERLGDWEPIHIIGATLGTLFLLWFTKHLIIFMSDFKKNAIKLAISTVRVIPGGASQINKETQKLVGKMEHEMAEAVKGFTMYTEIPQEGIETTELFDVLGKLRDKEQEKWSQGRVTGCIYVGEQKQVDVINQAFNMFTLTNPLHPDVFPSTRKFEAELIAMSANLLGGDENACGALTAGGTDSILTAMKTYRDSRPDIAYPEIVTPETIHPAFDKSCHYFGIKMIHVPIGADYRANVKAMEKAITKNTIAIAGSAPNYPHGMIDPIEDLAKIALKYKVGLHVDCCLGGFFLPWLRKSSKSKKYNIPAFDFRVKGVTSISADLHKYGMAPKGTSVVLFNTHALRRSMYFVYTEWSGGLYASPGLAGSRPGALIAGAYAMVLSTGQKGYINAAEKIKETTDEIVNGIRQIPGLFVLGEPKAMVVAWGSKEIDIFKLLDAMKGWSLGAQQKPNCLHLCVTYRHVTEGVAQLFLKELREAVENVRKNPSLYKELAPVYGMAAEMPDRSLIRDFVNNYLDIILKPF